MTETKEERFGKTLEEIRQAAEQEYQLLKFTDDFLFCKIMEEREDIARELVELILDKKISKVVVQKQETIEMTSDGKGIRLDVYAQDERETIYDLEMQTTMRANLAKRSRYYQGMIDLNLMKRGGKYEELRPTYIIFLCLTDPFGQGNHIYTFENQCKENEQMILGDETCKIFLNASGTKEDVSDGLMDFFQMLNTGEGKTELTRKIHDEVERAKTHEEWRTEYMTLFMRDQEMKEQGRQEGKIEGKMETLLELVKEGTISVRVAAEKLHMLDEEVENMIMKNGKQE